MSENDKRHAWRVSDLMTRSPRLANLVAEGRLPADCYVFTAEARKIIEGAIGRAVSRATKGTDVFQECKPACQFPVIHKMPEGQPSLELYRARHLSHTVIRHTFDKGQLSYEQPNQGKRNIVDRYAYNLLAFPKNEEEFSLLERVDTRSYGLGVTAILRTLEDFPSRNEDDNTIVLDKKLPVVSARPGLIRDPIYDFSRAGLRELQMDVREAVQELVKIIQDVERNATDILDPRFPKKS